MLTERGSRPALHSRNDRKIFFVMKFPSGVRHVLRDGRFKILARKIRNNESVGSIGLIDSRVKAEGTFRSATG